MSDEQKELWLKVTPLKTWDDLHIDYHELEMTCDALRAERDLWRDIAVKYRIGLTAEGHRLYDEAVDRD